MLRKCFRGVKVVSQGFCRVVTWMLQKCYRACRGVLGVVQGCYMNDRGVILGYYRSVAELLKICNINVKGVL